METKRIVEGTLIEQVTDQKHNISELGESIKNNLGNFGDGVFTGFVWCLKISIIIILIILLLVLIMC
jgi:hypothetical protein